MRLVLLVGLALAACGSSSPSSTTVASQKPAALSRVDGPHGALVVDDGGHDGVPVVFVHGLGGDHHVWDDALAHVRANRRAVAVDLHGFGKSAPGKPYDVASHAADLGAVVRAIGAPRVVLVGHSYGGFVVTELAAKQPDVVAGVVLVDPTADFEAMPADARAPMETMFRDQPERVFGMMLQQSAPGVSDRVLSTFRATDKEAFTETLAALFKYDPKPALGAYRGPRITIVGAMLAEFPVALHKVVPGIETHVIPDGSHWLFLDKPAEFNKLLDDFLARTK